MPVQMQWRRRRKRSVLLLTTPSLPPTLPLSSYRAHSTNNNKWKMEILASPTHSPPLAPRPGQLKGGEFSPLCGEFIRCQNRLRRILRVLPLSALPVEEGGGLLRSEIAPHLVHFSSQNGPSAGKIGLGFPGRWGNFGLCLFPSYEFSPTLIKEE